MSSIYGTRKCLICKKEFEPQKAAQVTCSEKCRDKRRREVKCKSQQKCEATKDFMIEWLNCKCEDLISQLRNIKINQKANEQKTKTDQKPASGKIKLHVIKCMNCGKEFKSSNLNDLFCGQYCKQQAMEGDLK